MRTGTVLLVVAVFLGVAFAGCMGGPSDANSASPSPTERTSKRSGTRGGGEDRAEYNFTRISTFAMEFPKTPNSDPTADHSVEIPANATLLRVTISLMQRGGVSINSGNLGDGMFVRGEWTGNETIYVDYAYSGNNFGIFLNGVPPAPFELDSFSQIEPTGGNATALKFSVEGWGDCYAQIQIAKAEPNKTPAKPKSRGR